MTNNRLKMRQKKGKVVGRLYWSQQDHMCTDYRRYSILID